MDDGQRLTFFDEIFPLPKSPEDTANSAGVASAGVLGWFFGQKRPFPVISEESVSAAASPIVAREVPDAIKRVPMDLLVAAEKSMPPASVATRQLPTARNDKPTTLTFFSDFSTFPQNGFGGAVGIAGARGLSPPKSPTRSIFGVKIGGGSSSADASSALSLDSQSRNRGWSMFRLPYTSSGASPLFVLDENPSDQALSSTAFVNAGDEPQSAELGQTSLQRRDVDIKDVLRRLHSGKSGVGSGISRDYWMSDDACRECYDCKLPFNAFRRKHHCRICGQIFCFKCAGELIPGEKYGQVGQLRVCNYCLGIIQEQVSDDDHESLYSDNDEGFFARLIDAEEHIDDPEMDLNLSRQAVAKPLNIACDSSEFAPLTSVDLRHSSSTAIGPFHLGNTDVTFMDYAATSLIGMSTRHGIDEAEIVSNDDDEDGTPLLEQSLLSMIPIQADYRVQARAPTVVLDGTVASGQMTKSATDLSSSYSALNDDLWAAGDVDRPSTPRGSRSNSPAFAKTANEQGKRRDRTGTVVSRPIYTPGLALDALTAAGSAVSSVRPRAIKHRRTMSSTPPSHVEVLPAFLEFARTLLKQLLRDKSILKQDEWEKALVPLLSQVTYYVRPDVRAGDRIDLRNYVKIKCITGAQVRDSRFVSGIMCTKNVAHKRMIRDVARPRIMVLRFALEYSRIDNQYVSLDSVMQQERQYLKNMISRIMSLQPTVLIVQHGVSRIALEFLLEENIVVAFGFKESVINAIIRCTRATSITSIDKLALEPRLGSCGLFGVRSFIDSTKACGRKSFLLFEDCPAELGCTLVLRGGNMHDLKRAKGVTELMVFAMNNLKLETAVTREHQLVLRSQLYEGNGHSVEGSSDIAFAKITESLRIFTSKLLSVSPGVVIPPPYVLARVSDIKASLDAISSLLETYRKEWTDRIALDADKHLSSSFTRSTLQQPSPAFVAAEGDLIIAASDYVRAVRAAEGYLADFQSEIAPAYYQHLLLLFGNICSVTSTSCQQPEVRVLEYYRDSDVSLGQYIEDIILNVGSHCDVASCDHPMLLHYRTYTHGSSQMRVIVEKVSRSADNDKLAMWSVCKVCKFRAVSADVSELSWKYSFGKFLELTFYGTGMESRSDICPHSVFKEHVRFFAISGYSVSFSVEPIALFEVVVPSMALAIRAEKAILLKQGEYEVLRSAVDRFFQSIQDRVQAFTFEAVPINKVEVCETELGELSRRANSELSQIITVVDQAFSTTHPADTFALNQVKRQISEHVAVWDVLFEDFSRKYLPAPERDFKRLTAAQLRKLFNERMLEGGSARSPSDISPGIFSDSEKGGSEKERMAISVDNSPAHSINDSLDEHAPISLPSSPTRPGFSRTGSSDSLVPLAVENEAIDRSVDDEQFQQLPGTARKAALKPRASAIPSYMRPTQASAVKSAGTDMRGMKEQPLRNRPRRVTASTSTPSATSGPRPRRVSMIQVYSSTRDATKIDSDEEDFGQDPKAKAVVRPRRRPIEERKSIFLSENMQPRPGLDAVEEAPEASTSPVGDSRNRPNSAIEDHSPLPLSVQDSTPPAILLVRSSSQPIVIPSPSDADAGQERSSLVKTLTTLWNAASKALLPLEYPIPATEHMFPSSAVHVLEDEPTSIIAFTLSAPEYKEKLDQMQQSQAALNSVWDPDSSMMSIAESSDTGTGRTGFSGDVEEILRSASETHFKYQFDDDTAKLMCKIFFADQFDALRRNCGCESTFVESLARCIKWSASGGKSGSAFMKTADDRYVVKQLSRSEMDSFLKFAPAYFEYMSRAFFHELPTSLAKIFGFYRIGYKNEQTGKQMRMDVVVMENLFYDRKITRIYDLKGSVRNRHVVDTGKGNQVLLDENLLESIDEKPLFVREHAKILLRTSVWNDTLFLSKLNVMDYSLLVGIDEDTGMLVVGIVDFIRTFTWDKKLESWVKESGFLGGGRKEPTIVTPRQYKKRFREAMERYFLMVPDKHCSVQSLFKARSLSMPSS